jgi:RNA polymerase sigma-70 factor (ECF subfamily)
MTKPEFQILFNKLYNPLCNYANTIVNDNSQAEDIVQEVLFQFWDKQRELSVEPSKYENYLVRAVKFKCIDIHRQAKVKRKYEGEILHTASNSVDSTDNEEVDYRAILYTAIAKLPEKTRAVFTMSKIDGLKYSEIAESLSISIKTVENQMGRAFKILRSTIKKENMLLLLIFLMSR